MRLICKQPLIPLYAGVGFEMVGPSDVVSEGPLITGGLQPSCCMMRSSPANHGMMSLAPPSAACCLQVHGQDPWFEMKWEPGEEDEEEEAEEEGGEAAAGGAGRGSSRMAGCKHAM